MFEPAGELTEIRVITVKFSEIWTEGTYYLVRVSVDLESSECMLRQK